MVTKGSDVCVVYPNMGCIIKSQMCCFNTDKSKIHRCDLLFPHASCTCLDVGKRHEHTDTQSLFLTHFTRTHYEDLCAGYLETCTEKLQYED